MEAAEERRRRDSMTGSGPGRLQTGRLSGNRCGGHYPVIAGSGGAAGPGRTDRAGEVAIWGGRARLCVRFITSRRLRRSNDSPARTAVGLSRSAPRPFDCGSTAALSIDCRSPPADPPRPVYTETRRSAHRSLAQWACVFSAGCRRQRRPRMLRV